MRDQKKIRHEWLLGTNSHLALVILLLGIVVVPFTAHADGAYVASPSLHGIVVDNYGSGAVPVSARVQKAILWDKPDGYQLHLWVKVATTNTEDFAWFIPFPAVPEVSEGDPQFFEDLTVMTTPGIGQHFKCYEDSTAWYYDGDVTMTGPETSSSSNSATTSISPMVGVSVESEGTAGVYDYQVLSASDPDALTDWLGSEGYTIPDGLDSAIEEYIDQGWFFFVAKIATDKASGIELLPPLVFDVPGFEGLTYPVKVTSLSLSGPWVLFMWVITDILNIYGDDRLDVQEPFQSFIPSNYPVEMPAWHYSLDEYKDVPKNYYNNIIEQSDKIAYIYGSNFFRYSDCDSDYCDGLHSPAYELSDDLYNGISFYYIRFQERSDDIEFCCPADDSCAPQTTEKTTEGWATRTIGLSATYKCCPVEEDTYEGCTKWEGGPVATEVIAQIKEDYAPEYLDSFPNVMERLLAEKGILEPPLGMGYYPLTFDGGSGGDKADDGKDDGSCAVGSGTGGLGVVVLVFLLLVLLSTGRRMHLATLRTKQSEHD